MAVYSFGQDQPNPFLANPPVVIVVRHVRVTASSEVVAENANTLPRAIQRIEYARIHPRRTTAVPTERTSPASPGTKRVAF